jgi:hypothetical protein
VRQREGVAYVEYELRPEILEIEGYWERPGTAAPEDLELAPGWTDPAEAIAWGRKRAPYVFLRLHRATFSWRYYRAGPLTLRFQAPTASTFVYYSAGEHPSGFEGMVRWPGASDERDPDVVPGYGGAVHLVRRDEGFGTIPEYDVVTRWETPRDRRMALLEQSGPWDDVEQALAWARERAPVVLLRLPRNSAYEYFSAGDEQPVDLELPTWAFPDEQEVELPEFEPTGGTYAVGVEFLRPFQGRAFPLEDDPDRPARWT